MPLGSIQANATGKKEYIYVRHSNTIDDSWIGTPLSSIKKNVIKKIPTRKPTKSITKKKYTYTPPLAGTLQVSDGSWILPSRTPKNKKNDASSWIVTQPKIPKLQKTKNTPTTKKAKRVLKAKIKNIILNSAPAEEPVLSNNVSSYVPTEYTTPNGTPLTALSNGTYTPPSSNKIDFTSLSASGGIAYDSVTGKFSDTLGFTN